MSKGDVMGRLPLPFASKIFMHASIFIVGDSGINMLYI